MRAEQKAAGKTSEPDKPKLTLEEERAQARARWLAYRLEQALGKTPSPEKGQEKDLEPEPRSSKGLDGPVIE